jgi:hypothetical protein
MAKTRKSRRCAQMLAKRRDKFSHLLNEDFRPSKETVAKWDEHGATGAAPGCLDGSHTFARNVADRNADRSPPLISVPAP